MVPSTLKPAIPKTAYCRMDFVSQAPLFSKAKLYDNCTMGRLMWAFWHFRPFVESVSYRISMGMKGSSSGGDLHGGPTTAGDHHQDSCPAARPRREHGDDTILQLHASGPAIHGRLDGRG